MKELVIIIGGVLLGCIIFGLVLGTEEDTLQEASKEAMIKSVQNYDK
ncbi:MAG: hypothetical protein RR472_03395 [Anaerovoracaceae bacterium]